MEEETTKTGLVAFFDILGYQNLLERNEPEKIAEEVLPILLNIGENIAKDLRKFVSLIKENFDFLACAENSINKIIDEIDWLVFSDTVLLTLPIEEKQPLLVHYSWLIFLTASIFVQHELFKAGLPSRGAIEYGKFFIKGTCFAGRPIVNAYQMCSQLELSACILAHSAAEKFNSIEELKGFLNVLVLEYLVPTKQGEKHLLTLRSRFYNKDRPNIHKLVMRAFWGNRKDIPLSVRQKAQNTEQWLEFLEYQEKISEDKNKTKSESLVREKPKISALLDSPTSHST